MRRTMTLLCATWLAVGTAAAADVKTQDLTLKSGDEEIKAFLAVPEGRE